MSVLPELFDISRTHMSTDDAWGDFQTIYNCLVPKLLVVTDTNISIVKSIADNVFETWNGTLHVGKEKNVTSSDQLWTVSERKNRF